MKVQAARLLITAALALAAALSACSLQPAEPPRFSVGDAAGRPLPAALERLVDETGVRPAAPYAGVQPVERELTGKLLSPERQRIYAQVTSGFLQRSEVFAVRASVEEDLLAACEAVFADHPELFWIDSYSYAEYPEYMLIYPHFNLPVDQIDAVQAQIGERVEAIVAGAPLTGSTYDRVRYLYEQVVNNTAYELGSANNQNIQSVFVNGVSVCGGYSRAFQYLCQRLDIPCAYILGETEEVGTHAWNLVEIDGVSSHVDTTWGDLIFSDGSGGRMSYDYLCVTGEEIGRDHWATSPAADALPACDDQTYDYYRLNGCYLDVFDAVYLQGIISSAVAMGDGSFAFKLGSAEDYAAALDYIASGAVLEGDLAYVGPCSYVGNDTLWTIEVWWA